MRLKALRDIVSIYIKLREQTHQRLESQASYFFWKFEIPICMRSTIAHWLYYPRCCRNGNHSHYTGTNQTHHACKQRSNRTNFNGMTRMTCIGQTMSIDDAKKVVLASNTRFAWFSLFSSFCFLSIVDISMDTSIAIAVFVKIVANSVCWMY